MTTVVTKPFSANFEMFTIIVKKLTHFFSKDFGFRVQFYAIKLNHCQIMKPIEIAHQQYLKRLTFLNYYQDSQESKPSTKAVEGFNVHLISTYFS